PPSDLPDGGRRGSKRRSPCRRRRPFGPPPEVILGFVLPLLLVCVSLPGLALLELVERGDDRVDGNSPVRNDLGSRLPESRRERCRPGVLVDEDRSRGSRLERRLRVSVVV